MSAWKARYAWTVRYQRAGWKYRQARYFRSRPAAERYVDKLLGSEPWTLLEPGNWSPLVYLVLEREPLGPAETVQRFR